MKIQVFYLEKYDDVITVRDKLNWVKTARVLLVMPPKGKILTRKLDLVLLQRTCTRNGSQLGFVTENSEVKLHAEQLGIPVFATITEAQKSRWRFRRARLYIRRRLENPPDLQGMRQAVTDNSLDWAAHPRLRWVRLGIFTASIMAVISLVVMFLPSATIQLEAAHQVQSVIIPISASPEINVVTMAGALPLRSLSVILSGEGKRSVMGIASLPNESAQGEVIFTNLGEFEVEIPAGTVLIACRQNQELIVTKAGSIPVGAGETVRLPVQAAAPGEAGNLPSRSVDAIKGPLGFSLAVTNSWPILGGSDRKVKTASQDEVNALRSVVLSELENEALNQIKQQLGVGDQLIPGRLILMRTIEETIQPLPGEPADQMTLQLNVEYASNYISGADLTKYANNVLDAMLEPDMKVVPGTLAISAMSKHSYNQDGMLTWEFSATRQVKRVYEAQEVARLVQGIIPSKAQIRLEQQYQLEADPVILMNPSWWPSLPIFPFRTWVYQGEGS